MLEASVYLFFDSFKSCRERYNALAEPSAAQSVVVLMRRAIGL